MKILFIQGVAGARFAYEPGDEVDLERSIARGFIDQGVAVPAPKAIETATAAAPETTSTRPAARARTLKNLGGLLP